MKIAVMNAQDMAMITIMMLRQTAMQRLAMIVRITGGRMMTNDIDRIQNAIRHIQTAVDVDDWARDIAVEAMQKQIPWRPMKSVDAFNKNLYKLYCPTCGTYIACGNSRTRSLSKLTTYSMFNVCGNCGQAIDWTEGEG